jgi:hypothetical protein
MIPVIALMALSIFTFWWAKHEFRGVRSTASAAKHRTVALYYTTLLAGFAITTALMALNRATLGFPLWPSLAVFGATFVTAGAIRFSPRFAAALLARI